MVFLPVPDIGDVKRIGFFESVIKKQILEKVIISTLDGGT